MDKKFLDKVVNQLVRETTIDYDNERVNVPFYYIPLTPPSQFSYLMAASHYLNSFLKHCVEVYGLKDDDEIDYIWYGYKRIINDKIENNG
tara:strand:+ start:238 stop:507 length:270 start_codon:yes stop_codon:yes gene_type:complete